MCKLNRPFFLSNRNKNKITKFIKKLNLCIKHRILKYTKIEYTETQYKINNNPYVITN